MHVCYNFGMNIQLINRTNQPADIFLEDFNAIADNCLRILKLKKDYDLSVSFVRSRTIHVINRDFRGIDRPTDVITFASLDAGEFFTEEEENDLGDIFINIDYARKQAKAYGHSYRREICFLFAHGLLHCLGYDHMTEADEKVMFDLQDRILDPVVSRK